MHQAKANPNTTQDILLHMAAAPTTTPTQAGWQQDTASPDCKTSAGQNRTFEQMDRFHVHWCNIRGDTHSGGARGVRMVDGLTPITVFAPPATH